MGRDALSSGRTPRNDGAMTIDPQGPVFPYAQLAALLREQVAAMRPDYPLPSVARLAAEYSLSPKTVRKALLLLEREGLVYVVPNRGFFCARRE